MVELASEGVASISPDVARYGSEVINEPRGGQRRLRLGRHRLVWGGWLMLGHLVACSPGNVAAEPEEEHAGTSSPVVSSSAMGDAAAQPAPTDTSPDTPNGPSATESDATRGSLARDTSGCLTSAPSSESVVQSTSEATFSLGNDAGASVVSDSDTNAFTSAYVRDGGVSGRSETSGSTGLSAPEIDAGPEPWLGPPIVSRSGFVDIEPVQYVRINSARTSSSARLFYSFRPADENPHLAPTFVFFNGGPGYGTSFGLLPRGTGPITIDAPENGSTLVANPWSWSQMGNLLYIDTRQAGLSYSTLPDPSIQSSRLAENNDTNFNDFLDAADLVRAMLRVLASTPGIQDNPVVLVGESYGGVRATMMLEFLLDYETVRTATWYGDPALSDEIAAHYAAVGANYADPRDQFAAQVLIQPFIAYTQFEDQFDIFCLPGSKEERIAQELGVTCDSIDDYRDAYHIDESWSWSLELDVVAGQHLSNVSSLQSLLGVDPTQIAGFRAADRSGAFRLAGADWTVPQPGFTDTLGGLQPWDAYFVAFNEAEFNYDVYENPYPCVYFARVAARVATFVTDADADTVVDTPALPTTMMRCQALLSDRAFVDSVEATHEPEGGEVRPGHWTITYNANSPEGAGARKVRWPTYAAGHMVAVSQPQQLFEDVRAFLRESDVIP